MIITLIFRRNGEIVWNTWADGLFSWKMNLDNKLIDIDVYEYYLYPNYSMEWNFIREIYKI